MPCPENPYAGEFTWVKVHIMRLMEVRTIRAWDYTRLTDAEADVRRQGGIYPTSLDSIRSRFAAQVAAGAFSQEVADRLFADSPYRSDQLESRSGKFWMVSHPVDVEDGGVEFLLESWGRVSWRLPCRLSIRAAVTRPLRPCLPLMADCSAAGRTNMCSTDTHQPLDLSMSRRS